MAGDNGTPIEARGTGGLDEFLVLERQGLAAHDPAHGQPLDRADSHKDQDDVRPEGHHQQDHEEDERQGIEHVDKAHHHFVELATDVAGDGAPGDADHQRHEGRHKSDGQRDPQPDQQPRQQIAPQRVRPHQVTIGQRREPDVRLVDLIVGERAEPGANDGGQHQHGQGHHAGDGRLVAHEATPRVFPQAAALYGLGLGDGFGAGAGQDHARRTRGSRTA